MMSLFSSFDLYFFNASLMLMFSFFLLMSLNSYFFSSLKFSMELASKSLGIFFYSLKPNSFNKFSLNMVFSLILVIFAFNFFSVFSFVFPLPSQFGLILGISLTFWGSFIIFSSCCSLKNFISHLIPEGTPIYLTSLLFLIELISNFIRPITLTVRLVANILAGHLLMILLSNLVFTFNFSFLLYLFLNSVELFVAMIQAYIFSTMITLYFADVH